MTIFSKCHPVSHPQEGGTHSLGGVYVILQTAPPDARAKELVQSLEQAVDLHARAFLFFERVAEVCGT
jgi:hypothetical protein